MAAHRMDTPIIEKAVSDERGGVRAWPELLGGVGTH